MYRLNESTRGHYKHNTLLLGNDSLPCSSPVRTSPCPAQRAALPFGMIICTRIRVVSCVFLKISSPRLCRQFSRNSADFQDYKYSFSPLSMKRAHVVIVLPWVSTARSIACHSSFVLCHCHTVYKNIRVHQSVLLSLLCVCIKSHKRGQSQLCMCIYIYI